MKKEAAGYGNILPEWSGPHAEIMQRLRELGYDLPEEFACFPPLILDDVSTFWAIRGEGDLLAPYKQECIIIMRKN